MLLLSVLGRSQDLVHRNGPKLGASMASISGSSLLSWSGQPKLGLLSGWSFETPLSQRASLLIEPMLMGKGSRLVNNVQNTRTSVSQLYLEMPLMLKLSFRPDPQGAYLSAGILYGYFLSGRVRSYQNGALLSSYDFSNSQGNSQWSLALGLGRERGNWLWELRGQSSVRLFNCHAYAYAHNMVMSFQAAWRFPHRPYEQHPTEQDKQ